MEKPAVRISVRNLVEFILRSGDLDNRRGAGDKEAMLKGSRLHRKIQSRMGSEYRAEVSMKLESEYEDVRIIVEGRADGIFTEDDQVWIDEIKGVYADIEKMEEPVAVHKAQAKCYAWICAREQGLERAGVQMTYGNLDTEEIRRFREIYTAEELRDWYQGLLDAYHKWIGVDYKFTSLRKTFACPDGGLIKTENLLPEVNTVNKFHQYKLAGSILKSLRKPEYYDDAVYLSMFEKGESMIDDEIAEGMSDMAVDIITKTDIDRLAYIRRRNAKFICDGLESLGLNTILPVTEDKIPLFVPVYLDDRNKVRKYMFQHNCFCPVHWPLEGMNVKKGAEMAEHELSIIVDQRYTNADMEYILDLIAKSI